MSCSRRLRVPFVSDFAMLSRSPLAAITDDHHYDYGRIRTQHCSGSWVSGWFNCVECPIGNLNELSLMDARA